jgi:hypothetical protein
MSYSYPATTPRQHKPLSAPSQPSSDLNPGAPSPPSSPRDSERRRPPSMEHDAEARRGFARMGFGSVLLLLSLSLSPLLRSF